MEDGPLALGLCTLAVACLLYFQFLRFTRDVPPEYLAEQSVIESTRQDNELAIHKSTKLDYSAGLRVGLGIRYSHYKLRNGNLYDVWELAVAALKKNPTKMIVIDNTSIEVATLNARAQQVASLLKESKKPVMLPLSEFLAGESSLATMLACFLSQTTLHVYDQHAHDQPTDAIMFTVDALILDGEPIYTFGNAVAPTTEFENSYTAEKDKGIAFQLTYCIKSNISVSTSFTQTNLVSAAASCVKHLPPKHEICSNDRLAVVRDNTLPESISNELIKVLVAFITGADLIVTLCVQQAMANEATILLAPSTKVRALSRRPSWFESLLVQHRKFSLSCLRFSKVGPRAYPSLRLIFAHRPIQSGELTSWNSIRAALGCNVIEEFGVWHAAGPIAATDFYEYREMPKSVAMQVRAFGAVGQSCEMKLVNCGASSSCGTLAVRGYSFGKSKSRMAGVGETDVSPDLDGFYVEPVQARWGTDGCIYILKQQ